MKNLWRPVALAALAALLTTSVAAAQETVRVTDVTIDKFGEVSRSRALVYIQGTITCDAVGPAETVSIFVTQQGATAGDNLALLDFACSTEPTRFFAIAENLTCESTQARSDCHRPGAALVEARLEDSRVLLAEQRVILRWR